MAHEFAHILQYKHSMRFNSNVHQEIHADILAGWYIGKYLKDIENKSIRLDINIVIATFIVNRRNSIKNKFINEIVKFENV